MEIKKGLFVMAAVITIALFTLIYLLNIFIAAGRENILVEKMDSVIDQYEEMQALSFMATSFGNDSTCFALLGSLNEMDKTIWDLGTKIDSYRKLSEEYIYNPFYIEQKKKFNRREVLYYLLLKDTRQRCGLESPLILYFYKKTEDCPDCDAQSFVLTDMKKDAKELSIFSFDSNLNSSSVSTLEKYYNITSYPCVVVEEKTSCSFFDKQQMTELICSQKNFSLCK